MNKNNFLFWKGCKLIILLGFSSCIAKKTSLLLNTDTGTLNFYNKDLNQNSTCPIDYSNRTFDMSEFGGSIEHRFSNNSELEMYVENVTEKDWVFDESDCTLTALHRIDQEVKIGLPMCQSCNLDFEESERTLKFNNMTSNPTHNGDFISSIYNSENELVAQYAKGRFYQVSEHYSLGQTIPLLPGTYNVKSMNENCRCENEMVIESFDICTNFLNQSYNGESSGPGANPSYKIPVSSAMSNIDLYWATQFSKDKILISYNGENIFDSGFVATGTSAVQHSIPFNYVTGVEELSVEVIPESTPSNHTIWTFGLGCCPTRTCGSTIPKRDLAIDRIVDEGNNRVTFHTTSPYTSRRVDYDRNNGVFQILNTSFKENAYTQDIGDKVNLGCVSPDINFGHTGPAEWVYQYSHKTFYYRPGACTSFAQATEVSCIDLASPNSPITAQESSPGSKIVQWDFTSLSFYNSMKSRMQTLTASFLSTDNVRLYFNFQEGACGSDEPSIRAVKFDFIKSYLSFDDVNKRMILDFSSYVPPTDPLGTCPLFIGAGGLVSRFINLGNRIESLSEITAYDLKRRGFLRQNMTINLKSSCGGDFDQEYYLHINDPNDPINSWELYKGVDHLSGIKVQDHLTYNNELTFSGSSRSIAGNSLPIQNIHGYNLGCEDIDFTKEFDLTPIHPLATQKNFTDGNDLVNHLTSKTGEQWKWHIELCTPYNISNGNQFNSNSKHGIQK